MPGSSLLHVTPSAAPHAPVVLVLPGSGYTVQAPLLYWTTRALDQAGWDVWAVDWHDAAPGLRAEDADEFVAECVAEAIAGLPRPPAAIVAKSLGTLSLPRFVTTDVRAVWFTPILTNDCVGRAAAQASAAHLLVGGSADPAWRPELLDETVAVVRTVPDADHGMELTDAAWHESAARQLELVADAVAHLDPRSSAHDAG